ncbi:MAG: Fe-S cluster assembly ATPase SufC [Candidatus Micrarchaeota archaeon]|nr:Fe-S cluster assembly ATPase SufC [Candidatus Micrarchaeota archaeon]
MRLEIKDLHISVDSKEVVKGVSLTINEGEVHVIMGPNGSGKTTLVKGVMGYPKLKVTAGDIMVDGESIRELSTDKRAKLGLFLQFQNPVEVEGVGFVNFLHNAKEAASGGGINTKEFVKEVKENAARLKMGEGFMSRSLNQGFSGGEKKKAEILQMSMLKPKIAILDEPDSGLDIDAVKIVAENINEIAERTRMGVLVITHYSRILDYMKPDFVHVMVNGRIVAEGDKSMIAKLEKEGYDSFTK